MRLFIFYWNQDMHELGYDKNKFVVLAETAEEIRNAIDQSDLALGLGIYLGSHPVADRVEEFIRVFNTTRNQHEFQILNIRTPHKNLHFEENLEEAVKLGV
jgi:hypothetical protein